ncbi:MAG: hypothetical protein R3A48_20240 [Polyangiales bacterium]
MKPDYERFGRQIALAQIGAEGQVALAGSPVFAPPAVSHLARSLWQRAGGGGEAIECEGPACEGDPALELGLAAWSCVESARRALGGAPPATMPDALLARLTTRR